MHSNGFRPSSFNAGGFKMWTNFVLVFTMTASLVLIITLPVMFATSIYKLWKKRSFVPLLRPMSIAGGLAIGIAAAWLIMVFRYAWPLSFWETFYATVHSEIYGELESVAEDYVFFMLFLGSLGAILAGIACWLVAKSRCHLSLTH